MKLHIETGIDAFEKLPEKLMLIERLELARGTLNLICAAGSTGKSLLVQHIASCVATGAKLFGQFPVAQGSVLHIDQEQSEAQTHTRYIRIGAGLDVAAYDIELRTLERLPAKTDAKILETYRASFAKEFDGYALVVIDSLRAITSADENNGDMEPLLKMLKAVAEDTGACVVVIHHKGKHQTGALQTGRGHSSIYDSIDVQIDINKHPDRQFELFCQKARDTAEFSSVCFTFRDEGQYVARRRCSHKLVFEFLESISNALKARVFAVIAEKLQINVSALHAEVKGDKARLIATLNEMTEAGYVQHKSGPKGAKIYSPTPKGNQFFRSVAVESGAQ